MDLLDDQHRRAVEDAIAAIPGLVGARLVAGYERPIDELHVLATLQKHPKQAVRDIQTLLMARFGITIDHRVVSVVQLDELPRTAGNLPRLALERVTTSAARDELEVTVSLRLGDRVLDGSATGAASGPARLQVPARATLAAVGDLLGQRTTLQLEGVELVETLGRRFVLTLLQLRAGRYETTLTGCVAVREVDVDAAVRSMLDALNRTLQDVHA